MKVLDISTKVIDYILAKINGIEESQYFLDKIKKQVSPEELNALDTEYSSLIEEKIEIPKVITSDQLKFSLFSKLRFKKINYYSKKVK